jgi:diguanylate cyclase (GGDEF)-like protein
MTASAYFPYIVTEFFCIIFAATLLFKLGGNVGSEHEVNELKNMIYSYFAMLVTDMFWALVEGKTIVPDRLPNAVVNAASLIAVALGCYFFYKFVEDRLRPAYLNNRVIRTLVNVPILIVVALDAVSVFTGWVFYIDAAGHYTLGPLFSIQSSFSYFYLILATVSSILRAVKTHSKMQRSEYLTYAVYMAAPMLATFFEDYFPTVPIFSLNIFMVILLLFVTIQNMQIYNDALTDLNNRRRLNQFLEERLKSASPERPVGLFMMDINRFKYINDTFGHLEGDTALKTFAKTLQTIAGRYGAFIARYGGDEFCLVIDMSEYSAREIEEYITEILRKDQEKIYEKNHKYVITVSVGSVICYKPEYDAESFVARADEALYRNKKEWHRLYG